MLISRLHLLIKMLERITRNGPTPLDMQVSDVLATICKRLERWVHDEIGTVIPATLQAALRAQMRRQVQGTTPSLLTSTPRGSVFR